MEAAFFVSLTALVAMRGKKAVARRDEHRVEEAAADRMIDQMLAAMEQRVGRS